MDASGSAGRGGVARMTVTKLSLRLFGVLLSKIGHGCDFITVWFHRLAGSLSHSTLRGHQCTLALEASGECLSVKVVLCNSRLGHQTSIDV